MSKDEQQTRGVFVPLGDLALVTCPVSSDH